eukprot:scaffold99436_cov21-Tisochrysis_lutea.AAC.1
MSRQARSRCPRGGNQRSSRACRCVGWGGMRRHVCRHPCVEVVELAQQRRAECWQDRVWTPSVGEGWPDWACRIGHGLGCWAEKEAGSRCCEEQQLVSQQGTPLSSTPIYYDPDGTSSTVGGGSISPVAEGKGEVDYEALIKVCEGVGSPEVEGGRGKVDYEVRIK